MRRFIRNLLIVLATGLLLPLQSHAQAIQNSATGALDTLPLDTTQATVTLNRQSVVDPDLSSVTVDPPVVPADGIAFSTITVTLRDINNQPLAGRLVSVASSRGALDVVTQPLGPTDINGVATGEIRSVNAGPANVIATDVADNVTLNDQPQVVFSFGEVLSLSKSVRPDRVTVGDAVTYTVEIQNTTAGVIPAVRISDSPSLIMAYVPGTARLDGLPIADPPDSWPLMFDVGDVAPLGDTNGNGVADPGESGYHVLTYVMVVGTAARPGEYDNVATAIDICDQCAISAAATATVEVTADPIFDQGTIIGKVFQDNNGDGWQDPGEPGVGGVMVALDSGMYALTDQHGRYHFPAVDPGQRLVKLNLASIAGNAISTGKSFQVLQVTPGLLAKANFGVIYDHEQVEIGQAGEYGIKLDSEGALLPDRITGSPSNLRLMVNGVDVQFAASDVKLGSADVNNILHMGEDHAIDPLIFDVRGDVRNGAIDSWSLKIWNDRDGEVKNLSGTGTVPARIDWPDLDEASALLMPGDIYYYQLEVVIGGTTVTSRRHMFGVNRSTDIALELRGGAFEVGSHELTDRARRLLGDAADIMREHPDEVIRIFGHTDATGAREDNQGLSERRARAAYNYLTASLGIPPTRFVVQGFGEDKPVASNDTASGRELNRRVEIVGELTEVERARLYETTTNDVAVFMDGDELLLDDTGQFTAQLSEPGDAAVELFMQDELGRSVATSIDLPALDLNIAPDSQYRLFAADDPRNTDPHRVVEDASYVYDLRGRTDPGNIVTLDGDAIAIGSDGEINTPLQLVEGTNHYVVSVRNPAGMIRYANLQMQVASRIDGQPVVAVEPIPTLVMQLPPEGIPLRNENLVVPGITDPGNQLLINGQQVTVDSNGQFLATIGVQNGNNPLVATVTDPNGHTGEIRRDISYSPDDLFVMAIADAKISQIRRDGNLAAAGATVDEEILTEGRVALYLKGTVLGKYLITAAFDTGQSEFDQLFSDLDDIENDRLITNIDPDTIYPIYGDDSQVVWDTDSQSKLYLKLEGEQFDAIIGNYALSLNDAELTTYQRTLFGARAAFASAGRNTDGTAKTEAELFVAQIDQAPVRDEIRATGGSLYFLSQTDIVEGSEQVSLLIHDQRTGLLLQRIRQQRGVDYDIKYREGRLWFRRPVSSVIDDGSLIGANLLSGNPITIQIDYETPIDGLDASVSGGRIKQRFADGRFGVGATVVEDDRISSQYSLAGVDTEVKVGGTRVVAEYAESEGSDSMVYRSEDGGLQFVPVASAGPQQGEAYKLAVEFDAGEWFGSPGQLQGSAYIRDMTAGFAANGNFAEFDETQWGAALSYNLTDNNTILFRMDDLTMSNGSESTQSSLLWRHERNKLALEGEYQDRDFGSLGLSGSVAALRAKYQWNEQFSTSVEHQESVTGDLASQTAAGIEVGISDTLSIAGRVVLGDNGEAFQAGATWDSPFGRLYAQQTIGSDPMYPGSGDRTTVGAEAPFGDGGTVYSEYQWDRSGSARGMRSIAGLRRDWRITDGLSLLMSAEQSMLLSGSGGENHQKAYIGGLAYDRNGVRLSSRNEWRRQTGAVELDQFASFNYGELRFTPGFSLLGEYRMSSTDDRLQPDQSTELLEASLGFALRPIEHDRWNVLFKLTRLDSEATPAQIDTRYDDSTADLMSVDWSLQLTRRVEWVGKQAMKRKLTAIDTLPDVETNTQLSIQRLNVRMPWNLSIGAEYRRLAQDEASDSRDGFLGEVMWWGFDHIGIGVGYNFTEFSSDLRFENDFTEYGWFLRLQSVY